MALNTLKCNHLMPLPFKGLKAGVIKWPLKLSVRFLRFLGFFQNPKNTTFLRITISRTLERTGRVDVDQRTRLSDTFCLLMTLTFDL